MFRSCHRLGRSTLDAQLLRDQFRVPVRVKGWKGKNESFEWRNVQHTLGVTRFLVSLELAARQHPNIELIHFDQLL